MAGPFPEIDLQRPPARPGPRFHTWTILALVWGVSVAFLIVSFSILSGGAVATNLAVVIVAGGIVASVLAGYAETRLTKGTSIGSDTLQALEHRAEDSEDSRRVADREERLAWKRYRRGQIGRVEYERLMARRRFAHGELTIEEYHGLMRELDLYESAPASDESVRVPPAPARRS